MQQIKRMDAPQQVAMLQLLHAAMLSTQTLTAMCHVSITAQLPKPATLLLQSVMKALHDAKALC